MNFTPWYLCNIKCTVGIMFRLSVYYKTYYCQLFVSLKKNNHKWAIYFSFYTALTPGTLPARPQWFILWDFHSFLILLFVVVLLNRHSATDVNNSKLSFKKIQSMRRNTGLELSSVESPDTETGLSLRSALYTLGSRDTRPLSPPARRGKGALERSSDICLVFWVITKYHFNSVNSQVLTIWQRKVTSSIRSIAFSLAS